MAITLCTSRKKSCRQDNPAYPKTYIHISLFHFIFCFKLILIKLSLLSSLLCGQRRGRFLIFFLSVRAINRLPLRYRICIGRLCLGCPPAGRSGFLYFHNSHPPCFWNLPFSSSLTARHYLRRDSFRCCSSLGSVVRSPWVSIPGAAGGDLLTCRLWVSCSIGFWMQRYRYFSNWQNIFLFFSIKHHNILKSNTYIYYFFYYNTDILTYPHLYIPYSTPEHAYSQQAGRLKFHAADRHTRSFALFFSRT